MNQKSHVVRKLKSPGDPIPAICFMLLVVIAAVLRLYALDRWSLWLDETGQYLYASKPVNELHAALPAQDLPISYLLGHAFIYLGFDQNGWQLRLPSAIFGIATVILVFLLGRELFSRRVAWFSGLLACVMPVLVIYSQEYRNYSLLILLTAIGCWSLLVALRTNHAAWWSLFVGSMILILYTHFVAINAVISLGIFAFSYALLNLWRAEPIKPVLFSSILAFGVIATAYVPAIPMLGRLLSDEAANLPDPPPPNWDAITIVFLKGPGFDGVVSLAIAGLAVLGVIWSGFRSRRALLFLVSTLAVPAILFVFHGYSRLTLSPRYITFLMPSYAVAIAAGLAAITNGFEKLATRYLPTSEWGSKIATAAATGLVILASIGPLSNVYAANPKQLPVDLRGGFRYILSRIKPNDLLLEASTTQGGSVYFFGFYDSYFLRPDVLVKPSVKGIIDDANFPKVFESYANMHGRLWVLITVGDAEQLSMQGRSGPEFKVRCFRRICAIRSLSPERPMLEQLSAFFDRFADLDPKYFAAPARAVRSKLVMLGLTDR